MDKRRKVNIRLSIMSITFMVISFISVTLAWFAYSGLSKVDTDVTVKSWYIEFKRGEEVATKDIVISLDDVKPGMETNTEEIVINNKGDSDASIKYKIEYVKILNEDNMTSSLDTTSDYIEDAIAHNYPFHINIGLDRNNVLLKGEENRFKISVSWPLDSGDDKLDSLWGNKAYQYQKDTNSSSPLIKIGISLIAEQVIEDDENELDHNYDLGKLILYDVKDNKACNNISSTCIKTHVIDTKNKIADDTVTLLPSFDNNYLENTFYNSDSLYNNIISSWSANTRKLSVEDVLKVISTDIDNTIIKKEGLSDLILGKVDYKTRASTILDNNSNNNASYVFKNSTFLYLASNTCYFLDGHDNSTFAYSLAKIDNDTSSINMVSKDKTCKVIPVIIASKNSLKK